MGVHPTKVTVDIVGLHASSNGRSCEAHPVCGSVLKHDSLVRFRLVQVTVEGREEPAIAVYWVTDGLDRCRVGFLPRYLIKHSSYYEGKLAQVVEFLDESEEKEQRAKSRRDKGVCRAVLVEMVATPPRKRARSTEEQESNQDNNEGHTQKYSKT